MHNKETGLAEHLFLYFKMSEPCKVGLSFVILVH